MGHGGFMGGMAGGSPGRQGPTWRVRDPDPRQKAGAASMIEGWLRLIRLSFARIHDPRPHDGRSACDQTVNVNLVKVYPAGIGALMVIWHPDGSGDGCGVRALPRWGCCRRRPERFRTTPCVDGRQPVSHPAWRRHVGSPPPPSPLSLNGDGSPNPALHAHFHERARSILTLCSDGLLSL